MGPLLTDAITRYDLNMVRGLVLLYSLLGVFGLFLGDVLMTIFDPRIRLTGKRVIPDEKTANTGSTAVELEKELGMSEEELFSFAEYHLRKLSARATANILTGRACSAASARTRLR